ncbi:MAG: helix-turn-helix transcriptional regulator, partial [Bdellovibrionales bacterium]|nr:helix-turn-helix transcriptional regulator [Bdellovibrionales bacterium]
EKKLYRNSGLKLRDLAETVNIPEYLVSQIINSGFKTNFYDLVNGFRIREAKGLLSLRSRESSGILEIAYEVGFNSKSAFNNAFKRRTGKTPSQFRQLARGESSFGTRI